MNLGIQILYDEKYKTRKEVNQLKSYRSRRQPIFTVYCIGGVDISP